MQMYEDIKSSLNSTLEIALGIEKVNTMINPKKAHTDGRNLVNVVYKEIQYMADLSKNRLRDTDKGLEKDLQKPYKTKSVPATKIRIADFKKNLSFSIKNTNSRLKQSRAGKKVIGQVLKNENLSFSSTFDKNFSSRSGTPRPACLPFVSFRTGKVEKSMQLPNFQEYLEAKGSNYMKTKHNDEIMLKIDRATAQITKFTEEFDSKASKMLKRLDDHKKHSLIRGPIRNPEAKSPGIRSLNRSSIFHTSPKKSPSNSGFSDTLQGFNCLRQQENQKFLDILDKIDLERPLIVHQKVKLIQQDTEKFRNRMHSLKKFEKIRSTVESTRRARQSRSVHQGQEYLTLIENLRLQRYKPSPGELEVLEFWKKMVELGWVVTKNDLDELRTNLSFRGLSSISSDSLFKQITKILIS